MDSSLSDWTDFVRAPEHEIDLAVGTLALARVEYPDLVTEHHVKVLDELAARSGTAGVEDPLRALHRLREFLFDEEGFHGNADDYYDPANSCLNQVLERVDLNLVLDRVDMNKLLAQVDVNQIVSRVDIEALVSNTDLGAIMVSSSSSLASEVVDMGRGHAVSMDDTLARWASKLRRNHTRRSGSPELPNAEEEP